MITKPSGENFIGFSIRFFINCFNRYPSTIKPGRSFSRLALIVISFLYINNCIIFVVSITSIIGFTLLEKNFKVPDSKFETLKIFQMT